jgi:hypothetical protein
MTASASSMKPSKIPKARALQISQFKLWNPKFEEQWVCGWDPNNSSVYKDVNWC